MLQNTVNKRREKQKDNNIDTLRWRRELKKMNLESDWDIHDKIEKIKKEYAELIEKYPAITEGFLDII